MTPTPNDTSRQGFSRGLPFPVALHQHPCCTAATPKGPQYCSFLVAQAPREIHSTRLLVFQRNGTDEGVPSGAPSAAGGENWTVASEIAAFVLWLQRNGTDESEPPGTTSAADGADWTSAEAHASGSASGRSSGSASGRSSGSTSGRPSGRPSGSAEAHATARIGSDEVVPIGTAAANAGGAYWTVAKEVATTGGTQLGAATEEPCASWSNARGGSSIAHRPWT